MAKKKLKVLLLSDHALSTSGVGTQSRHLINGLLEKGGWSFRQFGAALKHVDYNTIIVNDDFIIIKADLRLLYNLFKGPRFANWNSAEIGSHLKFTRSNDIYERGLFWCLNYLHS